MDLYGETFSDLRLQGDTFSSGVVEDCLFTRCRFQEVTLENFQVTGCQFVDCTFAGLHYKNMSCLNNAFQHCAPLRGGVVRPAGPPEAGPGLSSLRVLLPVRAAPQCVLQPGPAKV